MSRPARMSLVAVPLLVVLALGIWWGGHPNTLPDPIAKALVDDQTRVVSEALDTVDDTYYVKPKRSVLADNAIAGMVARLHDRFSRYFTPAEFARFQREQRSQFSGIGVNVQPHKLGLRVVSVIAKTPAERAGVRAHDIIVRAGSHRLAGLTLPKAASFVGGRPGTTVAITLMRGTRRLTLNIKRATVSAGFTASKLVRRGKEKVGVVHLSQFGPGAHADLIKALERLKARGATRYVLDLRDNPGGLVTEARLVASVFLKDGTVVTTRGRAVPAQTLEATGKPLLPSAPLAVLVNRDSASAAEIVASALQDHKRAEVVGTRTFGKGVFQQEIQLSNGGALDITAGQYFTPNGRNLGGRGVSTGKGVSPDIKASDNSATKNRDEALDRAVATVASAKA